MIITRTKVNSTEFDMNASERRPLVFSCKKRTKERKQEIEIQEPAYYHFRIITDPFQPPPCYDNIRGLVGFDF